MSVLHRNFASLTLIDKEKSHLSAGLREQNAVLIPHNNKAEKESKILSPICWSLQLE